MAYTLSTGSLEIIMKGGVYEKPIVQVLGIQKIEGSGNNDRFRLLLSDSQHFHSFSIVASQLHNKIYSGEVSMYSIIQINKFVATILKNNNKGEKRMIIILDIIVLAPGTEVGKKLGNPQSWTEVSASTAPTTTPVTPAPMSNIASTSSKPTSSADSSFNSYRAEAKLTVPIANLTPYQNKWCIKARVIKKTELKSFNKFNKDGKFFNLDLCDESGEIRATAFNKECDKFYNEIKLDKVYYIGCCRIKTANKMFNKLNNDYELMFTSDTVVAECYEEVSSLPNVKYDFLPISDIANKSPDTILDTIGVCRAASDLQELTAKSTGKLLKKREVTLVDQSAAAITLTLWGSEAENFDANTNPVIAVKGARLAEFNGSKSLSCLGSTMLRVNPDLPDAHRLRGWYDHGGASAELVNISARASSSRGKTEWMTFKEADARRTCGSEKGDYYNLLGVILYTYADKAVYKACPQEHCNKKVMDQGNGLFQCEKCGREYPNFKYRLLLGGTVADPTGSHEITAFNEVAECMLGKSAEEVGHLLEYNKEEYGRLFEQVKFKTFLFNLRSKTENYYNEDVQTIVMSARPIDYKDANSRFIKSIRNLSGIQV